MGDDLIGATESLSVGDVRDLSNFTSAVIDQRAFAKQVDAIEAAKKAADAEVIAGGVSDDREGWYVRPTLIMSDNPRQDLFNTEYFGPILALFIYEDDAFEATMEEVDITSPYGLTGAIFADDRTALERASRRLRHAAGNFYLNDKPAGAVVGQQPFGGSRGSGTNDKAGSMWNLIRWTSPRAIKETFVPPMDFRYPHQG
jgi:1-pyrroline-5-carboxylate dehydrogenase